MNTLHKKMIEHAQAVYPQESCGLVVAGEYIACTNVAVNPCENFEIGINEWQACDAVVHSHPEGQRVLSGADRQQQVATRLPWLLVVDDEVIEYPYIPPLKGRTFEYGIADCCSIIVDAYQLANIKLIDGERLGFDADIENNTIIKCFKKTGFYAVDVYELKAGDVLITKYDNKPSHASLYLGNEEILHHPLHGLSHVTSFNANWHKTLHSVWRHADFNKESLIAINNAINTF